MTKKNLWNKCTFHFVLDRGLLKVYVFYKKKQLALFNGVGGISYDPKFDVIYNMIFKK